MKGLLLALGVFSALPLAAKEPLAPAADKREFHLFDRTPRELLRDMSTDRPDVTESPHTVDAGWFQIEADFLNFSRDRHNTARANESVESWSWAQINFKAGLWHDTDLQIVVPVYNEVRVHDRTAGRSERSRGFGDLTVRWKRNIWGNDGGVTALAVMPFITLPTSADGIGTRSVEGGLIVPLGVELGGGWTMGLMAELDILENASGSGHHAELLNSIAVGRNLAGKLGAYFELVSIVSADRGARWVATANGGLTYALSDDLQLDAGVSVGLTRAADDINPFAGISWRF